MGGSCHDSHYWDALLRECVHCQKFCQRSYVPAKCTSYCEVANCNVLPGHFYDALLRKCIRCTEICGKHPAECAQHCKNLQPALTTKNLLVKITSPLTSPTPPRPTVPAGKSLVPIALEDSTVLLFSLLAVCIVLLFSSLCLAFIVLLRGCKTKTSNPGSKEDNQNLESVVQPGQQVGLQVGQQVGQQNGQHNGQHNGQQFGQHLQNFRDFVTKSSWSTEREPSDDSSPTETCVCVHCFPDLKALGYGNDRLPREPLSVHSQAVLHGAQSQKGMPLWSEENLYTSRVEVQEEAAKG